MLDFIRLGQSNKEIAQKLNIAEPTVKNHVHHLFEKLDVTTRAQAAARATLPASRRRPFDAAACRLVTRDTDSYELVRLVPSCQSGSSPALNRRAIESELRRMEDSIGPSAFATMAQTARSNDHEADSCRAR